MHATVSQTARLHFEIIDIRAAEGSGFQARWQQLSERACVPNPFWDPAICLPAIQYLGHDRICLATVSRSDGALVGFAPFEIKRYHGFGPKVVRLWTHPYLPLGSPLIDPDSGRALGELLSGLMAATGLPVLATFIKRFESLSADMPAITAERLAQNERAALKSTFTGAQYRHAQLSKKRRQGLDRRFRRLAEVTAALGPLEIKLCRNKALIPSRFEAFLDLENRSWKGAKQTAILSRANDAAFARQIAVNLAERNACMIATLTAGDTVLAALALFESGGEVFSWKTAYDEAYREYSPGTQLLARFADPLMGKATGFILDSCAAPGNELANTLWGERETVETILFSATGERLSPALIRLQFGFHERLRATAKRLLRHR